ncbi:MAG: hypothetical protein HC858_02405 [Brachymonas sp.]|nr:hypothetical protein [Brachymonas sp.]
MSLADAFPDNLRHQSISRQIKPGAVIKLMARMDDGQIKEKRFVVLAVSSSTLTCVINSSVNPYIANRDHLMRCQVKIDRAQHAFMAHDSFVDCSRIRTYALNDIQTQLNNQPEWLLGEINHELRTQILSALKFSPNQPAQVTACLEALGGN